ncbi:MAG: hypothetical protein FWG45_05250 [Oscillospiraceae bacterium]|nr:hypothetical protein [Oscillospiraceae bacterium]
MIWQMRGYSCKCGNQDAPHDYRWVGKHEFETLAIPAAFRFYARTSFNNECTL